MNTLVATQSQKTRQSPLLYLQNIVARLEQFRIKNHLCLVEEKLRRKDVSCLSLELQAERAKNLDRLHTYWQTEIFPLNLDFPKRRVPYFKDAVGTPCAVAYLMEQSGYQALVNTVASSNNHVLIEDVYDGPVLEWINHSGLTKEEAALIQPSYSHMDFRPNIPGHTPPPPPPPTTLEIIQGILNDFLMYLPLVIFLVFFITLEWTSYKISAWLAGDDKKMKWTFFSYFLIINVFIASLLFFIVWGLINLMATSTGLQQGLYY